MDDASTSAPSVDSARKAFGGTILLGTLFLSALSLRPQLVGIGPLIGDIQAELRLSHGAAGLLSTIPVLCMGLFAPVAALVAARAGTTVSVTASLALIGVLGLARALAQDPLQLTTLTVGIGVGMGLGGALLPIVVKERMEQRPLAGTIAYSSGVQLGAAASAALAVPIALAFGGWRAALAAFSATTLLLIVSWLVGIAARPARPMPRISVARLDFGDRRGLVLAGTFALFGTIYYGLVAWLADTYVERGWAPAAAGGLVGLLNAASLGGALTVGAIAGRLVDQTAALVVLAIGFAAAPLGLVALPDGAPAWAILAGYTNGALFPLVLALPLRLGGSADKAAGLSSVMLGGYAIAALAPLVLGVIRDVSGSFQGSLAALAIVGAAFVLAVVRVARWPDWAGAGG